MPRILILIVMIWNFQAAVCLLINAPVYLPAFELSGQPGVVAIRGVGVLFLMWQVPYLFAFISPQKNRTALVESLLMQFIGLIGETLLWISLSEIHYQLRSSMMRFIVFDGVGFLLLGCALNLVSRIKIGENKDEEDWDL